METSNHRSAVFIDVDLTLLKCESFRTFILKTYFKAGFLDLSRLTWPYFLRRLGRINIAQFKKQCLFLFKGMRRSELEMLGYQFSQSVLLKHIRPGARLVLADYKSKGLPIYLVSASPHFYIYSLSNQLDLSGTFATELKYIKDEFTGDFDGSECIGEEKLRRLQLFSETANIDLKSSFFYTDSFEDMPLLKSVGFPTAIWPDKRLKKICKKKGWPIEYW